MRDPATRTDTLITFFNKLSVKRCAYQLFPLSPSLSAPSLVNVPSYASPLENKESLHLL